MNSPATSSFTIFDIFRSVRKSPIFFVIWFLIFFSLVLAAYLILPRKYVSDGKLFVQVGRSSVGSDPTATQGTISIQDSRATEVKSVVNLLHSRELAGTVVDQVGTDRILRPFSMIGRFIEDLPGLDFGSSDEPYSSETDLTSEEIEKLKRRNMAIKTVLEKTSFSNDKNTTVISLETQSQSPFLSQDIINAYLAAYKKKHVEVNTRESGGFFNSRFNLQEQRVADAEKTLKDFRSGMNILDINGARNLLQKEIDQLKLEKLTTTVQLDQAKEKAKQMLSDYSTMPEFIIGESTQTSSLARDKSREALYAMQIQESELAAMFNDKNPKLVAIRNAIKKSEKQLKLIPESFSQSEKNVNTARQEVLVMLTSSIAESRGLAQRLISVNQLIDKKTVEIARFNDAELKENSMTREIAILKKTMLRLADKKADTETMGALDSEQISNVVIAQPGSLVPKKIFPSGAMFAALGACLAFTLSTVMTFFREFKVDFSSNRPGRGGQSQTTRQTAIHTNHDQFNTPAETSLQDRSLVSEDSVASEGEPVNEFTTATSEATVYMTDAAVPVTSHRRQARSRPDQQVNIMLMLVGFAGFMLAYLLIFVIGK